MTLILSSAPDLRQSCLDAEDQRRHSDKHQRWLNELLRHLTQVGEVSEAEFRTESFQRALWSSKTISSFGRGGAINVDALFTDQELISLLWTLRDGSLPKPGAERTNHLISLFTQAQKLIKPKVLKQPRLKLYNVFASLVPEEFLTLSFTKSLRDLAKVMGIDARSSVPAIAVHRAVLDRLNQVLGTVAAPPQRDGVERMTLPWLLLNTRVKQVDATTETDPDEVPGEEKLVPLPADRRRRSMLAIGGSFATVRSMLEFAKDGCVREDFKEHIRSINPRLSPTSVNGTLNALIGEWGVLEAAGDQLTPTSRGQALLENADPEDVSDWLITRILGFDNILYALRAQGATRGELLELLKKVNPGWTTDFTPGNLIDWQRALGLLDRDARGVFSLTDEGRNWAERIHWVPECLAAAEPGAATELGADSLTAAQPIKRPPLAAIIAACPTDAVFAPELIGRLDASLWSHARRHFAVLAGLSGSGKTLLAGSYARALWHQQPKRDDGLYIVPVQPGWHDPASLLGYVNPLSGNTYVRTGFLDFLLRASGDPGRPYTVVFDEMNLSHPEQYMAPLLSAMETGGEIELHSLDEDVGGVPPRLRYPNNLLIIGTVNMDETTHGLSDKILDRAAVLEFWTVDIKAYPGWTGSSLDVDLVETVRSTLCLLAEALKPVKLHFGWRSIGDILGYVGTACAASEIGVTTALDHAIFSKILPKLRGADSKRLRLAFETTHAILRQAKLHESADKVAELLDDLRDIGSARFWR